MGLFLGAAVVAGGLTAVGAILGVVVPLGVRLGVAVVLLGVLAVFELMGRADRLPQNRRLVPPTIMAADADAGPLQFGFEMGTGLRTFAPSALPLATVVVALLWAPGGLEWLALTLGFGLGRSLAIPARRVEPERWDRRMAAAKKPMRLLLTLPFAFVVMGLLRG